MILKERDYKSFSKEEESIRNDIIFRYVFGSEKNKKYLIELIKSLVNIDIDYDSLRVRNDVTLDKIHADDKNMRLDILADNIGGNISINIEIQNKEEYNIIDRTDNYASYIRTDSLKSGEEHNSAKKTIIVWILGYDMFKDNGPYHEESVTVRAYNKEVLSNNFKVHFFQIPKFIKEVKEIKTPEEQWLAYLSCQLNTEELEELFKMNRSIEEVNEIARIALTDKDVRNAMLNMALKEDLENLKAEYNYQKGKKENSIEIAKKLKERNVPIETIIELTGLTNEEIEKL